MAAENEIIRALDAHEESSVAGILALLREARDEVRARSGLLEAGSASAAVAEQTEGALTAALGTMQAAMTQRMQTNSRTSARLGVRLADSALPPAPGSLFGLSPSLLSQVDAFQASLIRSVSDELRASITHQVQIAALAGTSTAELAKQIGLSGIQPLGPFKTARDRAETIAVTELSRVANMATDARLMEAGETVPGLRKRWRSARDERTRVDHRHADGQTVDVDADYTVGGHACRYPCDPRLPASQSVRCILPGAAIEGRFLVATRSLYCGEVVEIVTREGRRLALTPNHPVATPHGFVRARAIKPGEHLLARARDIDLPAVGNDEDHEPALIEQVFEAFRLAGSLETRPSSAPDFHGDGERLDGDIEIAHADGELLLYGVTGRAEDCGYPILKAEAVREAGKARQSSLDFGLFGFDMPTAGLPRTAALVLHAPPVRLHRCPLASLGFGAIAEGNSGRGKGAVEHVAGNADLGRQRLQALPVQVAHGQRGDIQQIPGRPVASGDASFLQSSAHAVRADSDFAGQGGGGFPVLVTLDQVVQVRKFDASSHVYDLQSTTGLIVANGIYISNCRCRSVPIVPEDEG